MPNYIPIYDEVYEKLGPAFNLTYEDPKTHTQCTLTMKDIPSSKLLTEKDLNNENLKEVSSELEQIIENLRQEEK